MGPFILNIFEAAGFPLTPLIPGKGEGMSCDTGKSSNESEITNQNCWSTFLCHNFFLENEGLDVCTGKNPSPLGTTNENLLLEETFCHRALQRARRASMPSYAQLALHVAGDTLCVHRDGDSGGLACSGGSQRAMKVWISPALC